MKIIGTVIFFIGLNMIMVALNIRDKELSKAMDIYEDCVQEQYHTTPSAYRLEYGSYPEVTGCEILDSLGN